MIYRLEIENFYSVREREVIDLTVGLKVPKNPGRLVELHDNSQERAPQVVAIYGANASGKSNILRAIAFLAWFAGESFEYPAQRQLPYLKFQTMPCVKAPTRLSITFTGTQDPLGQPDGPTCPYVYTLELCPRLEGAPDRVLHESLHYRPKGTARMIRIFERTGRGMIKTGEMLSLGREQAVLQNILRPDASVISTLAQLNNDLALNLVRAARSIRSNIFVTRIEQDDMRLLKAYVADEDLLAALNQDIRRIDLGVERVEILVRDGAPIASFTHAGLGGPIEMPMESHGTQQFVRVYPAIHWALAFGGVAVIDELDSAIHPAILPEILRWFADSGRNPYGAQLWMSCHAVSLLDRLLKEEVLICEKSPDGATKIHRLGDIRGIRRDENFLQNYLGGVYGGVPNIG